ncbi:MULTISPECIES: hypothetical protein [unclassified Rhodococcus (in: high G+C Gram-positive bacteria)]|uniref:hypothetical protein n=1 Tax=unclassified Rhodococcus (in: high G+C Gram-positive bacteria) TaxID=192944 RepID=UPI0015C6881E|nr:MULTISPECIES: hypothetical protein [unclassified Rhodococcus (in: high G+C Gram-positive bacteria)]
MPSEAVVWTESTYREQWWRTVVGVETSFRECATADVLDQCRAEPFDDDLYPHTQHAA